MLVAIVGVAPLVISLHAPAVQPRDEDAFLAASPRPYVHMRKQKDDYWDPVLAAEVDPVPADSWQPEAAASRHVMQPAPATVAAHAWQPEEAALNDNTGLSPTSVLTAVADAATADSSGADARAPSQQQLEKRLQRQANAPGAVVSERGLVVFKLGRTGSTWLMEELGSTGAWWYYGNGR